MRSLFISMGLMLITDFKDNVLNSSQSNHISRRFNNEIYTQWIALGLRLFLEILDDDVTVVKQIGMRFSDHFMRLNARNCC